MLFTLEKGVYVTGKQRRVFLTASKDCFIFEVIHLVYTSNDITLGYRVIKLQGGSLACEVSFTRAAITRRPIITFGTLEA